MTDNGRDEDWREEEELHQFVVAALDKHGAWPVLLARAMKQSGQSRRGLLLCAVDGRAGRDAAKLLIPVATQPQFAPLCCQARRSNNSKQCEKALKDTLEGHAGLAFQFFPATMWKTLVEPQLGLKVNRANLKAEKILLLVAFVMLPSSGAHHDRKDKDVLLELAFYEEGARLPRTLTNKLTTSIKMELGTRLNQGESNDGLSHILRSLGLDHEFLSEVPEYQQFVALCKTRLQTLLTPAAVLTPVWVNWQGTARRLDLEASAKIGEGMVAFFEEHYHIIEYLQNIMGHERLGHVWRGLDADLAQNAQQMAYYSRTFTGQLLKPCPACGLPCPGPYPCPCKRPVIMTPAAATHLEPLTPRTQHTLGEPCASRRRGKNLQTSFAAPVSAQCRNKTKQAQATSRTESCVVRPRDVQR